VAVFLLPGRALQGAELDESHIEPTEFPEALEFTRNSPWRKGLISVESQEVLVCSEEQDRLQKLHRQLEFAEKDMTPRLGSPGTSQRLEVWDIHDSKVWRELLQHLKVRHEGVALQVENRIYLQPVSNGEGRYLALFHEWVHYAFWSRGWSNLPLWAEEGVAQHYAWNTAQRYARSQRRELTRRQKPVSSDYSFAENWRTLLKYSQYPENPEEARQVYQCSEYLVRAILRRLRIDQHASLWNELSKRPGQLELILNKNFRWTSEDWAEMELNYNRFIQNSLN
jgi:hypothetical protein